MTQEKRLGAAGTVLPLTIAGVIVIGCGIVIGIGKPENTETEPELPVLSFRKAAAADSEPLTVEVGGQKITLNEEGLTNLDVEQEVGGRNDVITQLPIGESELESAFNRGSRFQCKILGPGKPLMLSNFIAMPLPPSQKNADKLPPLMRRMPALSVGLNIGAGDRGDLPTLSSRMILSYLDEHYVSIQAQVLKDPATREVYLHPKPVAATAAFRGATVSAKCEPAVLASIENFRSLGLLVKPDTEPTPADLRTLVLLNRCETAAIGSNTQPKYELAFIRVSVEGEEPRLRAFVTSNDRTILHDLGDVSRPFASSGCDILASVFFTKYSHASLVPSESAVRKSRIGGQQYSIGDLEKYLNQNGVEGDIWANMLDVIDALASKQVAR